MVKASKLKPDRNIATFEVRKAAATIDAAFVQDVASYRNKRGLLDMLRIKPNAVTQAVRRMQAYALAADCTLETATARAIRAAMQMKLHSSRLTPIGITYSDVLDYAKSGSYTDMYSPQADPQSSAELDSTLVVGSTPRDQALQDMRAMLKSIAAFKVCCDTYTKNTQHDLRAHDYACILIGIRNDVTPLLLYDCCIVAGYWRELREVFAVNAAAVTQAGNKQQMLYSGTLEYAAKRHRIMTLHCYKDLIATAEYSWWLSVANGGATMATRYVGDTREGV